MQNHNTMRMVIDTFSDFTNSDQVSCSPMRSIKGNQHTFFPVTNRTQRLNSTGSDSYSPNFGKSKLNKEKHIHKSFTSKLQQIKNNETSALKPKHPHQQYSMNLKMDISETFDFYKQEHINHLYNICKDDTINQRTVDDMTFISSFLNQVPFIKKIMDQLSNDKRKQICQTLCSLKLNSGGTLAKKGDRSKRVFFLVKGKVGLSPSNSKIHMGGVKEDELQKQMNRTRTKRYDEKNYMSIKRAGDMFGEWETKYSQKRSITYNCLTPCFILLLKREDFRLTLGDLLLKHNHEITNLQSTCTIFRNWTEASIGSVIEYMKKETFQKNHVVYDIGDSNKYIYIILNGSVDLMGKNEIADEVIQQNNDSKINLQQNGQEYGSIQSKNPRVQKYEAYANKGITESMDRKNDKDKKKISKKKKLECIARVCRGGTFGDDEGFQGAEKYTKKFKVVVSSSHLNVYKIHMKMYLMNIRNHNLLMETYNLSKLKLDRRLTNVFKLDYYNNIKDLNIQEGHKLIAVSKKREKDLLKEKKPIDYKEVKLKLRLRPLFHHDVDIMSGNHLNHRLKGIKKAGWILDKELVDINKEDKQLDMKTPNNMSAQDAIDEEFRIRKKLEKCKSMDISNNVSKIVGKIDAFELKLRVAANFSKAQSIKRMMTGSNSRPVTGAGPLNWSLLKGDSHYERSFIENPDFSQVKERSKFQNEKSVNESAKPIFVHTKPDENPKKDDIVKKPQASQRKLANVIQSIAKPEILNEDTIQAQYFSNLFDITSVGIDENDKKPYNKRQSLEENLDLDGFINYDPSDTPVKKGPEYVSNVLSTEPYDKRLEDFVSIETPANINLNESSKEATYDSNFNITNPENINETTIKMLYEKTSTTRKIQPIIKNKTSPDRKSARINPACNKHAKDASEKSDMKLSQTIDDEIQQRASKPRVLINDKNQHKNLNNGYKLHDRSRSLSVKSRQGSPCFKKQKRKPHKGLKERIANNFRLDSKVQDQLLNKLKSDPGNEIFNDKNHIDNLQVINLKPGLDDPENEIQLQYEIARKIIYRNKSMNPATDVCAINYQMKRLNLYRKRRLSMANIGKLVVSTDEKSLEKCKSNSQLPLEPISDKNGDSKPAYSQQKSIINKYSQHDSIIEKKKLGQQSQQDVIDELQNTHGSKNKNMVFKKKYSKDIQAKFLKKDSHEIPKIESIKNIETFSGDISNSVSENQLMAKDKGQKRYSTPSYMIDIIPTRKAFCD